MTVNGALALLTFSGSGSFTDPDLAGHTYTATVNYGDGTGTHSLALVGTTFTLSHAYSGLVGTYTITVTVIDNDGVWGQGQATVIVLL